MTTSRGIPELVPALVLAALFTWGGALAQGERPGTTVIHGAEPYGPFPARRVDVDLRDLPRAPAWEPGMPIKEIPKRNNHQGRIEPPGPPANPTDWTLDPLVLRQQETFPGFMSRDFDTPLLNFDGQGFTGVQPPDTVGDIGTDYYIQMINGSGGAVFSVYDKSDGSVASGPTFLDSLGSGFCGAGFGDPIVVYDQLAGRWLLAEFSSAGNRLCFYISQTGDPIVGGWYAYELDEPPSFPDYFKIGVWPDAYYVSSNEGAPAAYAFDRSAMLDGDPTTGQRFSAARLTGFGFQALQPADADGATPPPAGAPGIFVRHRDDEVHNPGSNVPTEDYLELYEFSVDFDTPANSTFTGPVQVAITEIDSDLCGLDSFNCFPQLGGGTTLDPLREVVMWRLQYRNFGSHEAMVGSLVTDVDGTDHGGVRWFELRKSGVGGWTLFQEGTYAPDAEHRWMSSIAMDANGNIAVGYSVSSTSIFAGIRYAGRLVTDTAGTLPQGENTLIDGQGNYNGNRWGDYSSMNVDPVDECTFWYTNEYGLANGAWQTRIGSFQLACEPNFTLSGTPLSQAVCAPDDLTPIDITVGEMLGFSDPVTLALTGLPSGFSSGSGFTVNPVSPPGTSQVTVSVDNTVVPGPYGFDIEGSATGVSDKVLNASVQVFDDIPGVAALTTPADSAIDQALSPTFMWAMATQGSTYTIEIDDDPGFGSIDYTAPTGETSHTISAVLQADTEYFWRVRSSNTCGVGTNSVVFSFRTANLICSTPDLAIPDGVAVGVTDDLVVGAGDTLTDLDVLIQASHTWVGDLVFELTHVDTGTSVVLIDQPGVPNTTFGCDGDDMNVTLDDEAALAVEDQCGAGVPTIDGSFIPNESLSAFDGETLVGTWRMRAADVPGGFVGTLDTWCLLPMDSPSADLSTTKDDGVGEAMPGDTVVYTITVTNNGPSDVVGAEVDDVFGADFDNVSWTCTPTGAAACSVGGVGDIDDTVDIPVGDSVVYEATVDLVGPGAEITNTATVTAPIGVDDPNGANNSASDTNTIVLLEDGFESPAP